jgi:7-carboxy-7-deazaguanine synthase
MEQNNVYTNISHVTKNDELKFVIADENDFDFAINLIDKYHLLKRVHTINFSPVFGEMSPDKLAELILTTGKNIKLMLQMHKFIWDPNERAR